MVAIHKNQKSMSYDEVYLDENEKLQIKRELTNLINLGGSYIFVENKLLASNMLPVYDSKNQKIGYLVGNTAVILGYIISKSKDNPFCAIPISIHHIIQEYCM